MRRNFLKEYLVKIGWDMDKNALQHNNELIDKVTTGIATKLGGIYGIVAQIGLLTASLFVQLAQGAWQILSNTEEEDMAMRQLAKQYYTTADAMRAHENALKQLGIQYEDLFYATDDVVNEYYRLVDLGKRLEAPEGLSETLAVVREIKFQFKSWNSFLYYFKRNLSYYIGQKSSEELQNLLKTANRFTDWLLDNQDRFAADMGDLFGGALNFMSRILENAPEALENLLELLHLLEATGESARELKEAFDQIFPKHKEWKPLLKLVEEFSKHVGMIADFMQIIANAIKLIRGESNWKEFVSESKDPFEEGGEQFVRFSRRFNPYLDTSLSIFDKIKGWANKNDTAGKIAASASGLGTPIENKTANVNSQNYYYVNSTEEVNSIEKNKTEQIDNYLRNGNAVVFR